MSLKDVARIVGYGHGGETSRHERLTSVPSLRAALRYEALYRVPITKLFSGLYEEERKGVEDRLSALFDECRESTARGRRRAMIARKLEWAWERANADQGSLFDLSENA